MTTQVSDDELDRYAHAAAGGDGRAFETHRLAFARPRRPERRPSYHVGMTPRTGPQPARLAAGKRAVAALLMAAGLLLALAKPADAHAVLQATTPVDGEALDAAPAEVTLQFSERVRAPLGAVRVFDTKAERIDLGDAGNVPGEPTELRVGLPDDVGEGAYIVTWSAVSADGHPIRGAFLFTVGDPAAADDDVIATIFAQSDGGESPALAIVASALRFLIYGGSLLAIGAVIFLLWVHDRRQSERPTLGRIAAAGAAVAGVASVVGIAVQGSVITGLGAAALVDPAVLAEVAGSNYGAAAFVRLLGLSVLLMALPRLWNRPAVIAACVAAAAVLSSFVITGHAASADPRWLVVGATLSHTLAGAAWFGGLILLLVALRSRRLADDPGGGGAMVARFSTLATAAIILVSVAGAGLMWAQVRAPRALIGSAYGWTLIGKVTIVAAVLAVAAYNQRRLVPAITQGAGNAWQRLRRTVGLEVVGLMAVVLVTAVLVNLVPAKTAVGVTGPFSTYVDLGEAYQVNLTVDPNRAGDNEMHVYLLGQDGRPADVTRDLTLGFSMPEQDIGPIERKAVVAGPGHWLLSGRELSIPGDWTIDLTVRVNDFEQLSTQVPISVNR